MLYDTPSVSTHNPILVSIVLFNWRYIPKITHDVTNGQVFPQPMLDELILTCGNRIFGKSAAGDEYTEYWCATT